MRLDGTPFENSATCKGVSFVDPNAPHDLSVITISGRYPEDGRAINEEVHELVYILEGSGSVEIANEIQKLEAGDVISIPPGKPFFWNGQMKLIMSCQPAFNPEQYSIKDDHEI